MRTSFFAGLVLFTAYYIGIFLSFENEFKYLKGRLTLRRRLSSYRKKPAGKIEEKLSSIVFAATGKEDKGKSLIYLSLFLFILSFGLARTVFSIFFSLITALSIASAPTVSLVSIIHKQRSRSRKEGLAFTGNLQRQYIIGNKNIYTALERASSSISEYPVCGKHAYLLLLRIRSAEGRKEARAACKDFSLALGSEWARALSMAVLFAYGGRDVSEALLDILERLKNASKEDEERKRSNSEAVRMTLFLVPFMYIVTAFMAARVLGTGAKGFLENQLKDPLGLGTFIITVLLFLFNILLLSLVNGTSSDI